MAEIFLAPEAAQGGGGGGGSGIDSNPISLTQFSYAARALTFFCYTTSFASFSSFASQADIFKAFFPCESPDALGSTLAFRMCCPQQRGGVGSAEASVALPSNFSKGSVGTLTAGAFVTLVGQGSGRDFGGPPADALAVLIALVAFGFMYYARCHR